MRLLAPLVLAACGYSVGLNAHPEREPVQLPAIAVAPFDNVSYRRGLEIRLTRLLADELRARSPDAPHSAGQADFVLEGSIVRAEERVLSEDTEDRVRESSFVVSVQVFLRDRTTEKVVGSYRFTEQEPFSDRAGRIVTVDQAANEALRDVAESIVYWLEARSLKESS